MGKMKEIEMAIEEELYNSKDVEVFAEEVGCDVKYAKPTQLFLDLDSEEAYSDFRLKYAIMSELSHGRLLNRYRASKSRNGNTHIIISLCQEVSVEMQLGLQAVLGSDPMRELFNFGRLLRGDDVENCLFVPRVYKEAGVCQSPKEL